ncbi:aldose epimerase family protein [Aquimarina gracilis]|uniref:Aldose 1-epimerase n=1 Tax=Aquimarina gracilis TaxID=874422 RepID=A0ABU5ZRY7_9FLAO|nr:aldose epimerase family protein [Aquimarina gracilis]MEB3344784.1 aldose epimerase family protein [Aquimarina gracilis]
MKTLKRKVKQKSFGFHNQKELLVLSLRNDNGMRVRITNFAATIMSLDVPNAKGGFTNVIVGFDSLNDYVNKSKAKESKFLGASIGRYAGRVSNNKIKIADIEYPLYHENGIHLHGGKNGFDEKVWDIDYINEDDLSIALSYISEDMEEGYPGNLRVKVIYQLTNENTLKITYHAISDRDTVVNLTNHAYYNLNGSDSILDHSLQLNCSQYLEVDNKQLPTGKVKSVVNTKFDFLQTSDLRRIENKGVLDDTLIFDSEKKAKAILISEESGIKMEVTTNQPAVVIYTPEKFPDWKFRKEVQYDRFPAICFETQNYPDAPNHVHFPSSVLKAGEHYESCAELSFSIML